MLDVHGPCFLHFAVIEESILESLPYTQEFGKFLVTAPVRACVFLHISGFRGVGGVEAEGGLIGASLTISSGI